MLRITLLPTVYYQISKHVQKLWELYDQHCPKQTKTISYKKYIKPWITDDLIQLINDKHINCSNNATQA